MRTATEVLNLITAGLWMFMAAVVAWCAVIASWHWNRFCAELRAEVVKDLAAKESARRG